MNKSEYLKNRFKKDFLQYSLLQEDSLSAKEIADKLYREVDAECLVVQCQREKEAIIDKYLSFDKVKVEGKLSNELSAELGYDIKDRIIAEYRDYLDNVSTDKLIDVVVAKIERSVELQTWSNGIVNMQDAIAIFVERLQDSSNNYGKLSATALSEDELLEKFNKAKQNTLLERIQGNNIDDIIEYRGALMEYVRVACENMLCKKLQVLYDDIVNNDLFCRLQNTFEWLLKYAKGLKDSIVDCEKNEEWNEEYNRLVPTDFYYRNVENITAEHAFHMVLLQFFAKNETWMKENGMLVNGELKVFCHNESSTINNLVIELENYLV